MEILSGHHRDSGGRRRPAILLVAALAIAVTGVAAWLVLRHPPTAPSAEAPSPPRPSAAVPAKPSPGSPAGRGAVEIAAGDTNATVFVDGRRLGPAPQRAELDAGAHRVRVEKPGHRPYEREVHIIPGRTLRLQARLEVEAARLRVEADVPGAQVFLDRTFVGEVPVVIRDVSPGPHRLNVSAEGYEMHTETVEVASGSREIRVRFKEVRLDETLEVKHRHGLGSCQGRLVATRAGLRYESEHAKDSFDLPFAGVEPLQVDYLKKNLRVKVRGGRTYNFAADDADALLTFQKTVEAARARLR